LSYIHIIASYDETNMIFEHNHMSTMRHMRLIVIMIVNLMRLNLIVYDIY